MSEALVEKGKDTPVTALSKLLEKNKEQIAKAVPEHLKPERLIRMAITALNTTPMLQSCSLVSICNSVMLAAQLGLEPNNGLGHCWLIPYKGVCTMQPGYRGLLELAYRSGKVKDAQAHIVYRSEHFIYSEGASPVFEHVPLPPSQRGEEWVGAYSRLTFKDGYQSIFWMWREEIEEIRDKCSKADKRKTDKDGNPVETIWDKWFWEMCKKTVIKRHLKTCQLSTENHSIGLAVGTDDQAEAFAASEPAKKPELVQDLVLEGPIIDEARSADDALAGSRDAQAQVAEEKLEIIRFRQALSDKAKGHKDEKRIKKALSAAENMNELRDVELMMNEEVIA